MRLFIISDSIYPYNKGGKETRIEELTKRLSSRGVKVSVLTMKWWSEPEKTIIRNGIKYIGVCRKISLYSKKGVRSLWQAIFFGLALFFPLVKERKNYDLIDADQIPYFQLITVKLVCLIFRKKFFCTWHEVFGKKYWEKYSGKFTAFFTSKIEYISANLPDKIIAVSNETADNLHEVLSVSRKKIEIIENGVDVKFIDQLKPSSESFDIVFAGRLIGHKNVNLLLQAVAFLKNNQHKNIRTAIIGQGPEEQNLKKLVAKLKLNNQVKFFGFLPTAAEVFSVMKASKIFVTLSSREGFGISVLEAYACGLPVITSAEEKNFARFLVKNNVTGKVVGLKIEDIAEKIARLLDDENSRQSMILKARQFILKFDWDALTAKLLASYSAK